MPRHSKRILILKQYQKQFDSAQGQNPLNNQGQNAAQGQGQQNRVRRRRHRQQELFADRNNVVTVFNLSYDANEEDIYQFFNQFQVVHVQIIHGKSGRPGGTALVEFSENNEANNAYKHWMVIKCMIEKFASIAQLKIICMIMKMANFLLHRMKLNLNMNMKSPDHTNHSIDDLRREMNEGITRINNNLTALADVFNRNFRR